MKKLILLFAVLFSFSTYAGTPIATKSLGVDSITGLDKQLQVWSLTIDAKAEKIVVVYDIVLLYNSKVVSVLTTDTYTRYNRYAAVNLQGQTVQADMRFEQYRNSELGIAISQMIQQTINNYPTLEQQ